jgi:hypothetical protein
MKKYTINFTTQSLNDIEEAVNYYNEQLLGLGNKFLLDFDNVHCAAFKRFPFSVHYEIDESNKTILIVAVFNTWKKPFW